MRTNSLGACVRSCHETSACVAVAVEKSVKDASATGLCVLGNSSVDIVPNAAYYMYHLKF